MRNIKEYEKKSDVAIYCSSLEEWYAIKALRPDLQTTKEYGFIREDGKPTDCIHINGKGTGSKNLYDQRNYTIYPASEFLEDDILEQCNKKYPIGTKYKCSHSNTIAEVKGKFFEGSTGNKFTDGYGGYVYYEGKFAEIIEEPKFEVGKWYKYSYKDNYYFKPVESGIIIGRAVKTSEEIRTGIYTNTTNTWSSTNETKLADLSEIQQYLPNGHVDKIKIIPEYVELLPGFDTPLTGKIFSTKGPQPEEWGYSSWEQIINISFKQYFKPSTKEAYEAQNVKQWSRGTYVVCIKDCKNIEEESVHMITHLWDDNDPTIGIKACDQVLPKSNFKWFATEFEAEEFAKTLKTQWIPQAGDWAYRLDKGTPANKVTKGKVYLVLEGSNAKELRIIDDSGKKDTFDTYRFRKALPNEIPKQSYVKCISTKSTEFTLNKIYKIEGCGIRTNKGYLCMDNIRNNLSNYYSCSFEYSTEQEYLIQQGKQVHEKVVSNIQVGKSYPIIDKLPNTIGIIKYFESIDFFEDLVSTGNKVIKKETLTELELPTPIKVIKREESYY